MDILMGVLVTAVVCVLLAVIAWGVLKMPY
jgi:hypothetical protein